MEEKEKINLTILLKVKLININKYLLNLFLKDVHNY